jgi:hypothetical protein
MNVSFGRLYKQDNLWLRAGIISCVMLINSVTAHFNLLNVDKNLGLMSRRKDYIRHLLVLPSSLVWNLESSYLIIFLRKWGRERLYFSFALPFVFFVTQRIVQFRETA